MKIGNAIEVKNIKKSFKIYKDGGNQLKELALFKKRRNFEIRSVINDISFEVKKGEAIGLIGHNGCGKSTTLKLLTKIIYPDSGTIEMKGRVSSLIELGAGFHPDLSGRENIYINASIFGLHRDEIEKKIDEIIAFSELEDFIDNPVRTYSSGMYMRLAFSVAINVNADILLIDEILAVGDANFQAKCFNKLREIKAQGVTIVIVSHSLGQIEEICERTLWVHEGTIRAEGKPRDVHPIYLDFMSEKRIEISKTEELRTNKTNLNSDSSNGDEIRINAEAEDKKLEEIALKSNDETSKLFCSDINRYGNGKARIISIEVLDDLGNSRKIFNTGENVRIRLQYVVKESIERCSFGIGIFKLDGFNCYGVNTRIDKVQDVKITKDGYFEIKLKKVQLLPGKYSFDVAMEANAGEPIDYYKNCLTIEMQSFNGDVGLCRIEHEWILNEIY